MSEQVELSDLSREQMEEVIRRIERKQSLKGQKDVVKATAAVVRMAAMKLENEISQASERAVEVKSLDACFVLDCTWSMEKKIQAAKEKIVEIQSRIMSCLGVGGNLRFSVVGYRDYNYSDSQQFEILPFTGDVEEVKAFLSTLEALASEGADECEDVIGGLDSATQLEWKGRTRIIYLVSDFPPHGVRFTDQNILKSFLRDHPTITYFDNHPNDQKQWEKTDQLMAKSLALNLNFVLLDYAFAGCPTLLDQTFQVISDLRKPSGPSVSNLQTLRLKPENTADDFVKCILESTKETISKSLTPPASDKSGPMTKSEGSLSLDVKAEVAWKERKSWPVQSVLLSTVNVVALARDAKPTPPVVQRFRIRQQPFAEGSMRYSFPATDFEGTTCFVLKVHKSAKHVDSMVTRADVKTQAYAKFFAEEFSQRFPQEPVQFLEAWAIELPKWPIARHATMELFVSGVFQKYTSNNGFISPEASLAEALCHFSWCHSGGQMMVTDLQGFGSRVFTDPQIHCVKKDFFSSGNLGKDGMDQFFLGHCCNEICQTLQLKASPIQLGWDTETASVISDSCGSSQGSLVCQYCSAFVSLRNKEYLGLIDEYQAIVCSSCKEKVEESSMTTRCMTCEQPFKYSMYAISVKGSSVPPVCRSCEQGEVWKYIE